jgi:Tol biopolymer transport system component
LQSRLGPYEVLAPIGAGGMGEVLRARDPKLGREVAIKVLPAAFAQDAERVARFRREAQILASLNHSNIAAIYGLEEGEGTFALVMELVEGEDLAQRLKRGAIPEDEAIAIAKQIAEALEEAHERGIVHRDLKPANVKVTADGKVKVLDFGLAKAFAADPMASSGAHDLSQSPTLATAAGTQAGVILGTAAYMSPEQARGKAVDRRTDIWAFGVVVFEMLTGRRLFAGETVSDVLAGVLKTDVDWNALPPGTPPVLRQVLERCLERNPRQRLQAIGEARAALEREPRATVTAPVSGPATPGPGRGRNAVLAVLVVAAVALAGAWIGRRTASPPQRTLQASLPSPAGTTTGDSFALSPDARWLAFEAWDHKAGARALWLRDFETGELTKLEGTAGAELPFWSPDGGQIGFFAGGKLKRVAARGGAVQELAEAPNPRGATWGADGRIVLSASFREGLSIVAANGGPLQPLTKLEAGEKSHRFPVFLPGGESLLFLAQSAEGGTRNDPSGIDLLDLRSGKRTRLVASNSSPLLDASAGALLFWRDGALLAQRFDASGGEISGEPVEVAASAAYNQNEQVLASAASGTLVYREGTHGMLSRLIWVDRSGLGVQGVLEGGSGYEIAVSPDGKRLAIAYHAPGQGGADIWIHDSQSGTSNRLTFEEGSEGLPVWSSDGVHIVYGSDRLNDGTLFRRRADGGGAPEELGTTPAGIMPLAVSRDGSFVVVHQETAATVRDVLRFDVSTRKLEPLVATPFLDDDAALTRDDRLLAYRSEQSGRSEIYVQSLGSEQGRWQISSEGGRRPRWRADGRELFFLAPPDRLMSVDVTPGPVPRFSAPRELFRFAADTFDVAPDGQRFVVSSLTEGERPLTVVAGWARRLN